MNESEIRLPEIDFAAAPLPNLHEILADLRAKEPVSLIGRENTGNSPPNGAWRPGEGQNSSARSRTWRTIPSDLEQGNSRREQGRCSRTRRADAPPRG